MRKILLILLVAVLTVPLAACSGGAKKLSEKDSGAVVRLRPRGKLEIALDSNPTTGYRWEVASMDESVLRQVGEPEFKSDSKALGAGGKTIFTFQAVSEGKTVLKLIYRRSWEKKAQPAKVFEVSVEVK